MKYLTIFFIIFAGLLFGCRKEYMTVYTATLINKSQHNIVILFYINGLVSPNDTVKLDTNKQFEIANGSFRGLKSTPGFLSEYSGGSNDSTVVIFDNKYKITHYGNTPLNLANKYYLFSSLRNIFNPLSYRFVTINTSSVSKQNDHYYDFVEQDYLDAK